MHCMFTSGAVAFTLNNDQPKKKKKEIGCAFTNAYLAQNRFFFSGHLFFVFGFQRNKTIKEEKFFHKPIEKRKEKGKRREKKRRKKRITDE